MARKQSGGFNRFLNVIGLVDDGSPRESANDYNDGYGRPSTYVPQQQRSRTEETRRRTVVPNDRSVAAYDRYANDSYQRRQTAQPNYRAPRQAEFAPPPSRFGSYPQDTPPARQRAAAPGVQNDNRQAPRQRTLMYSLHTLEECREIIENIIRGNTVVLTLDDLDIKLMQRAVDTLSGAAFALHATIRKASDKTYLIAPNNVEVNEAYDIERRY